MAVQRSDGDLLEQSPFAPILSTIQEPLPAALQEQYLLHPDADYDVVLGGRMSQIWHRPVWLWPLFWLLAKGDIFFPETGNDVPTTLTIRGALDELGRSVQLWERVFHFPSIKRRYTSTMYYDTDSKCVMEMQGPGGIFREIAQFIFTPPATVEFLTVRSTLEVGKLRIPLHHRFWIVAHVVQTVIAANTSHVALTINHPWFGPIFGYEGTFRSGRRRRRTRRAS